MQPAFISHNKTLWDNTLAVSFMDLTFWMVASNRVLQGQATLDQYKYKTKPSPRVNLDRQSNVQYKLSKLDNDTCRMQSLFCILFTEKQPSPSPTYSKHTRWTKQWLINNTDNLNEQTYVWHNSLA